MVALATVAVLLTAVVAGVAYLRIALHGEGLASTVSQQINAHIRGHVEVESITWKMSAIPRALVGKDIPVKVRHVRVYDELGDLVLETEFARGEIAPWPAALGHRDLIVGNIELPRGGYVLIRRIAKDDDSDDTAISLVSAFEEAPRHGLFPGTTGLTPSRIIDLRDFEVDDVTLEVAFPDEYVDARGRPLDPVEAARERGFYARAEGVSGRGFLYRDSRHWLHIPLYFGITASVARGSARIHGTAIDIEELEVDRLAQMPPSLRDSLPRDLELRARGRTAEGGAFEIDGAIVDYLDDDFGGRFDLRGELRHGGDTLRSLTGGALAGDDFFSTFHLGGRVSTPRLEARAEGASFDVDVGEAHPPIPATVPEAIVSLDLSTGEGRVDHIDVRALDGAMIGEGSFLIDDRFFFEGDVEVTEPLEIRPYLPPQVVLPLGTTELSGTVRLAGSVDFEGTIEDVDATEIDMRLGRARISGKQRYTRDGRLHTEGLRVRIGRTSLMSHGGSVDLHRDLLDDIRFSIRSRDFDDWLRRYESLPVARTLDGEARYEGPREEPRLTARLVAREVPILGEVAFRFTHQGERAGLRDMRAHALDGEVRGGGEFSLGLQPWIRGFDAEAKDLDLSRIPIFGDHLLGRASATLRARGPFANPELELEASASELEIAGEPFPEFQLSASAREDGARSIAVRIARDSGGALVARADVAADGRLEGAIELEDLDLSSLVALGGDEPVAGGKLAANVDLSGTVGRPDVRGRLSVRQAWFHTMYLGAADVDLEPAGPGVVRVDGRLFGGLAEISGTVETVAPYRAELDISAHRAELDRVAPELAAQTGARGWVSGRARVRGPLLAPDGRSPEVDVVLTEAVVHVDQTDVRGRPRPIRLKNQTPIHIALDGGRALIHDEAVLAGPDGSFRIAGGGRPGDLDLTLRGALSIDLLAPYVRQQFDDVTGTARLDLKLTGAPIDPRLSGTVELEDVELRLAGQDAILRAPAGKIDFTNDQLAITGLAIEVVDPYSDEIAELTVGGGVGLDDFHPTIWALHIHGTLGGKLLLALFPEELSSARGAADLSVSLLGHGSAPNIDGEIRFATERPLSLAPRGMRRDIVIDRGLIRFTDDLLEIESVGGWVDDEGHVTDVSGEIGLVGGQPADIDVTVSADDLPFSVPRTLELLLGLRDVRIVGHLERGLEIAGDVRVIDGRYVQNFNPLLDEIRPQRVVEVSPPFYETIPILATADLSLGVETRSFFVRNNVANVELSGGLEVTGTPAQPQLDGVVRVEGGSISFQGVRADFQRTTGTVTFERFRRFPDTTPTLDIRSESEYRDFSGEDHLVVLTLTGPLGQLHWDLFTTAGLNKAQTFLLIVSGRTPEEARRVIGDEPVGRGPGDFAGTRSTEAPDGNLALVDQLVKDLAGDFFSLLIEDSIRNVTDLDVARLQLGTASVGFHGEKRFTRSFRVLGDLERSLRGWAWDVRGEYRLLDQLSVEGEYLQKSFDEDVEEDVKNFRVKAVWRWLIP